MIKTPEKIKALLLAVAFFIIGYLTDSTGWRIVCAVLATQFIGEWIYLVQRSVVIKKVIEGNEMPADLKEKLVDFIKTIDPNIDEDCGDAECEVHGKKK